MPRSFRSHSRRITWRGDAFPSGLAGWISFGLLVIFTTTLVGCGSQDDIRTYTVPKKADLQPAPDSGAGGFGMGTAGDRQTSPTDALLGAVVPHGDRTWYFKMTGPVDAVATQKEAFRSLIQSLTFDDANADPQWELPPGWTAKPSSGQRLATLIVSVQDQELATSVIPMATSQSPTSLLDNINRWRRQMNLPPIAASELEPETTTIDLDSGPAVLIDLAGRPGRADMAQPQMPPSSVPSAPKRSDPTLPTFTKPEGWIEAAQDGFSLLAFEVQEKDQSLRITVSMLGGTGGGIFNNVNRWRGQVGLDGLDQASFEQEVEQFQIEDIEGFYVEAIGPETDSSQQAIFGWVGLLGDHSWFIKMRGDAQLARQQRDAFRDFLKSIRFDNADGASNES